MSSIARLRCGPRSLGMMQNEHGRSQPSAIFTYARVVRADAHARRVVIVDVLGRLADLDDAAASCACRRFAGRWREHLRDRLEVGRAEDVIDLGDVLRELVGVALREAAGDDQLALASAFLYSAISRMVSTLSSFAASMNAHVLTTMTSASSGACDQRVPGGLRPGRASARCRPGSSDNQATRSRCVERRRHRAGQSVPPLPMCQRSRCELGSFSDNHASLECTSRCGPGPQRAIASTTKPPMPTAPHSSMTSAWP